jgi:thiol-disulfide isomerase/thioredoxin
LQKESYLKMVADLRKSMLNETAPAFALLDLDGKNINVEDLKGKVVVVDFWATWCGPCKASFPAMQKMVNKYKEDPNIKFVFIDTWEKGENKKKEAADFITTNKYSFHVLLDNEDKVVAQFKVDGIPTKFVIDKNGNIRFKAVGFDGSDDKLVDELTAMIELASEDAKKAF